MQVYSVEPEDIAENEMRPSLILVDEADRLKMTGVEHLYIKYNQG